MIYTIIALTLSMAGSAVLFFWDKSKITTLRDGLDKAKTDLGLARDLERAVRAGLDDKITRMGKENASLTAELDLTRNHLLDVAQKLALKDPGAAGDFLDGVLGDIAASDARRGTTAMPAVAAPGPAPGGPSRKR